MKIPNMHGKIATSYSMVSATPFTNHSIILTRTALNEMTATVGPVNPFKIACIKHSSAKTPITAIGTL
jgi:hypothetical protein